MEWEHLLCDRRFGSSEGKRENGRVSNRTEFERDYDRLIFSAPFRRLQNKTQVFPLPGKIFVHNRLTHSLEVSCLGRSMGDMVSRVLQCRYHKKNIPFIKEIGTITSAACLAHDLGNPPFGHSGEAAIGAYFSEGNGGKWKEKVIREGGRWEDFTLFEGNANGLRMLTNRFRGRRVGGFALTYSTIASIIKYPWGSNANMGKNKFGFLQSEEQTMSDIVSTLGLITISENPKIYSRYPLVYIVEAADDICYQIMDIEDAYKLNILSRKEAKDLLFAFIDSDDIDGVNEVLSSIDDYHEQIGYLRSRAINSLVEESTSIFLDNERAILDGRFEGRLMDHLSPKTYSAYGYATEMAYERIYCARAVQDVELAGHTILHSLLDKILDALDNPSNLYSKAILNRIPFQFDTSQKSNYSKVLCALDYISSMTDIYALDLYRQMTGMNLPAI